MSLDGSEETEEVVGTAESRGDNIGEIGKMDVLGLGVGSEEGEPLVGDDKGDENVGVSEREKLAEIHESVDVVSAGLELRWRSL
ncbi:unnamed protein product [Citrullus colocynthis]|uniref:Uncharacterized protein n=1 Tax=Citrullus colocynthis TaxID=252529 RepID=A0ABP0Y2E5_9ROSI